MNQNFFDISTEFSRNLARALFPGTSRGRSISKMAADGLNTDTRTVHFLGILGLAIVLISKNNS